MNPGYLASCNNRGKGDKRVVDPWVGHLPSKKLSELKKKVIHQVRLNLVEIHVEGSLEAERGRHR